MSIRIGVDIGGTFTDFALFEDGASHTLSHKNLTTPDDPSRAVVDGLAELLQLSGHSFADISILAHGTTLVTNAVIERKGSPTGMLVTEGFADIVDIGRENRYELFDLRIHYAEPLVRRQDRIEIGERTTRDGTISRPVDEEELTSKLGKIIEKRKIRSLAICFLNSFRNPHNEIVARDIVRRRFPEIYLSTSSHVASSIKEFERWSTTLINAYTQPLIDQYLARLESELTRRGFVGTLRIMTSSGGVFDGALARALPARLIESGPAAGILMASELARTEGLNDILAFDIGGTTAKGAFIQDARPIKKYEMEVAREQHYRPGSGLPVRVPVIDMMEIGSGGGSIVRVDQRGLVAVGPTSASSKPGPACYGLGGQSATLTDANLVLGFLDADYFLGGKMRLSTALAEEAVDIVRTQIGSKSGEAAAEGVREIACEDIAAAFRTHAAELGLDVRRSTLVAFGGSGPLMATQVARKLRIKNVLFPAGSGIFSAIGLLASPASFEVARSYRHRLATMSNDDIEAMFSVLRETAGQALASMKVEKDKVSFEQVMDLRYVGQGHQVRVIVPQLSLSLLWHEAIKVLFEAEYRKTFSITSPEAEIEVTDWRVVATEKGISVPATSVIPASQVHRAAEEGTAVVWHKTQSITVRKISRYALRPGDIIRGPALVQEVESTCVLLPGDVGTVLHTGHILVRIT